MKEHLCFFKVIELGKILLDYLNTLPDNSIYSFTFYNSNEYDDINLRAKIFYGFEDFCILLDGENKIRCVLGIENKCLDNTSVANLTFISDIKNIQHVSFILSFLVDTYANKVVKPISKIRATLDGCKENCAIISLLEDAGFFNEAKLEDELGKNRSVLYYAIVI